MLSGINAASEKFLQDLGRLQKRSERAQQQLTSGLKVQSAADAPDDISRLLGARAGLDMVQQVSLNLGRIKTEVDTAEGAMQNAVSLMERARALGSQGASNTLSKSSREQLANELGGILERLVAVSSTAVEGRYIFSGDNDQAAPYTIDLAVPKGVSTYQGASSTRLVADASGLEFSVAQTADEIFDSADDEKNVFLAVNGMRRALLAVDSPPDPPDPTIPTMAQALHNLGEAGLYLNTRLTRYGLAQNRVTESINTAAKLQLSLKAQIANIEEADLAAAALELSQTRTHLEAAFTARAQNPRRSLFDYMG
jgi:flagellar hook-associated protein 3 FlgL